MDNLSPKLKRADFHLLKIHKKAQLAKNTFSLEFSVPEHLKPNFQFEAGQYVTIKYESNGEIFLHDYSITAAPFENEIALAIKINSRKSSTYDLFKNYQVGDEMEVSEPRGRFTLVSKPDEFRTILGFAGGIGITPIFSHFKNILYKEPRTRLYLFYGNKTEETVVFEEELDLLEEMYGDRFSVYYFFSQKESIDQFFQGRIDNDKLKLIINQLLNLDDTDEESTVWDSVDEVLICGKGEMIKSLANGCYESGIPKKNIHFELFEEFNDDIYPQEKEFPLIENIEVEFTIYGKTYTTTLESNRTKLLQQLLMQNFPVPYSCKSGICGSCECTLEEGEVELLENEYLTESEEKQGRILACMSVPLSKKIKINFDLI